MQVYQIYVIEARCRSPTASYGTGPKGVVCATPFARAPVRRPGATLCRGCGAGSIPAGGSLRSFYIRPARKLIVGEPPTADAPDCLLESVAILVLAFVEPERLLIEVTEQVVRLDADVGSLDPAL